MRFVVVGAGAIGGVVGARLFQHGHDVLLVARGEHGRTISERGLTVESPDGVETFPIPCVYEAGAIPEHPRDVVLLAVKSQDTDDVLRALHVTMPADTPIVCLQNGVANERRALRRFDLVHGVCVMCPTGHLEPGVVQAFSAPVTGLLDIGRYPSGEDATTEAVAAAFNASGFESVVRPDIMRWKYAKLLTNLGNALDAVCGPEHRGGPLGARLHAEGEAVLRAAGIDYASTTEDRARRGDLLTVRPSDVRPKGGSSSWQSLARGTGSIEADDLNGEIALLGRLHGVPTPANSLLQRVADDAATQRLAPGSISPEELLALLPTG